MLNERLLDWFDFSEEHSSITVFVDCSCRKKSVSVYANIYCPYKILEEEGVAEKLAKKIGKEVSRPSCNLLRVHYFSKGLTPKIKGEDVADEIMAAATEIKSVLRDFPGIGW
jgi:hypothetical protein